MTNEGGPSITPRRPEVICTKGPRKVNEFRRETVAMSREIFAELDHRIGALKAFPTTELQKDEQKKIAQWCEHRYQEMAPRASEIASLISSIGTYVEKYKTPRFPDLNEVNERMDRLRRAIDVFAEKID
jgi:hypothetical protein